MFFHKVLKGITELPQSDAQRMLDGGGIVSNWWRLKGTITEAEKKEVLTHPNLIHHLDDYDLPLPLNHLLYDATDPNRTYGNVSPFISTSAGAIQRDSFSATNILFHPFITSLEFATDAYSKRGWIFYAYLLTIGKRAVELSQFSEEVRELHIYTAYRQYHQEGEITGKIVIPSVQIEKAEEYDGPAALQKLRAGALPAPTTVLTNPDYVAPDPLSNIRELLD